MSPEKIKELLDDFSKALKRLEEALTEDLSKGNIIIDGAIQRFEFTFELSWKLTKAVLNHTGIEAASPRAVIKEAFKANVMENGEGWIDMLEDRNKTSHIYDEEQAIDIYKKIKKNHFPLLKNLEKSINELYPAL